MNSYDPRTTPWVIDESDFYEFEKREDQIGFILRYAVLAPSTHNTQPWSFRIVERGVEVYADFTRRMAVADPRDRELMLSIGAAIANLRVAAAHFGYESSVEYQVKPEESLAVAVVTLRETSVRDESLAALFPFITRRRTNRQPFEPRTLDEPALSGVCDFIDDNAKWMRFVLPHDRDHLAELVEQGEKVLMANDDFREELAGWLRPNETSEQDGICGDAFGLPGPLSALGPWAVRQLELGPSQGRRDRELTMKAAGLIVITSDDTRVSLIQAGEKLEQLLLLLTSLKVDYSFLNAPIEVDSLRNELWAMLRSEKPPQLLLRIGYAPPVLRPMPRRPVDAVVAK
jgi:hypothetical protein